MTRARIPLCPILRTISLSEHRCRRMNGNELLAEFARVCGIASGSVQAGSPQVLATSPPLRGCEKSGRRNESPLPQVNRRSGDHRSQFKCGWLGGEGRERGPESRSVLPLTLPSPPNQSRHRDLSGRFAARLLWGRGDIRAADQYFHNHLVVSGLPFVVPHSRRTPDSLLNADS